MKQDQTSAGPDVENAESQFTAEAVSARPKASLKEPRAPA